MEYSNIAQDKISNLKWKHANGFTFHLAGIGEEEKHAQISLKANLLQTVAIISMFPKTCSQNSNDSGELSLQ